MKKDKLKDSLVIIFLFLLPFVFFYKIIFLKQVFLGGDIIYQNYPQRVWFAKNIKEGIFPMWCPEVSFGYPLFAEGQTGMLFPFNILYVYLPGWLSYNLSIVFNFIFVSIFMYFLMRILNISRVASFFASIFFSYLGWFYDVEHINTPQASIWLPLIFYFIVLGERKNKSLYFIFSGIFFGIQFLAGYPQVSFFISISLGCYWLFKIMFTYKNMSERIKFTGNFLLILLFGMLISSPQIIPQIEVLKYSARQGAITWEEFTIGSVPPLQMINAIFLFKTTTESINYLLLFSFPLIIISLFFRKNTFFLGMFIVFTFILCLGKYLPGYKIMYHIPVFNWFKYPDKISFLSYFAMAPLIGFGLQEVLNKKKMDNFLKIFAIFYFLFCVCFMYYSYTNEIPYENFLEFFLKQAGYQIIILNILLLIFYTYTKGELNKKYFFIIFLFFLFSSIYGNYKGYWKSIEKYSYSQLNILEILSKETPPGKYFFGLIDTHKIYNYKPEFVRFLTNYDKKIYRVGCNYFEGYLLPNLNLNYNISHPGPYYGPLPLKRVVEYASRMNLNLLSLANVKYIVSNRLFNDPELEMIYNKEVKIYKYKNFLQRTFVVRRYKVADESEILYLLNSDIFYPEKEVLLEEEPEIEIEESDIKLPDRVDIIKYKPHNVEILAELISPGMLILTDTYYPGWRCYVNGKEKKIYQANYIFRGIYLEEGKHRVKFIYNPLSFKISIAISILSLIILIIFAVYKIKSGLKILKSR